MKLADLHLHTYFSDGTFSPEQLVEEAKKAGLFCISVTDHDSLSGIEPVKEIAADSLEVISGIELSSEINTSEIHILGYFIDSDSSALNSKIEELSAIRKRRAYDILEKLKGLGVNLDLEEVFKISAGGSVSRLHIAKAMLDKGIISHINEAFTRYIGNKGPAYVGTFSLTPQDAIRLIKDAHGIPVLAHPYISNCDELIPSFVKAGLRGLEAYYPEHSESVVRYYLKLAERYGLLLTGGSDCHGTTKPNVKVGKINIPYELVEKLKQEKYG
jgi:predicted metal-dependent phosphoesterase TrpH